MLLNEEAHKILLHRIDRWTKYQSNDIRFAIKLLLRDCHKEAMRDFFNIIIECWERYKKEHKGENPHGY
jgi:hypothetical protein